ncbi:hypothetical protein ES705_38778 [subsurface metagenome]
MRFDPRKVSRTGHAVFWTDHIHVALQDHRFAFFHSRAGWFPDENISDIVAYRIKPVFLRESEQVPNDLLF